MRGIGVVGGRQSSPSFPILPHHSSGLRKPARSRLRRIPSKRSLLLLFAFLALAPPLFFHFRLRRFQQMRSRKCGWLERPPLVCAHGGDSSKAVPNTMDAYRIAIDSRVDCIEIDISRSSDGVLFALHDRMIFTGDIPALHNQPDGSSRVFVTIFMTQTYSFSSRDLQRISGNSTTKVGYMNKNEIKELDAGSQFPQDFLNQVVPTAKDALAFITSSVKQVILDAKVGPPLYEKDLARDIISIVKSTHCKNCLVWSKSDNLSRDVIELTQDAVVGYIVMPDPSTGARSKLLRMKGAEVVGVYHRLVDEKLVGILHREGKKVYAWTVDDAESMQRMLLEQVDAIITSNPQLLQRLMQDIKTECLQDGFP